MSDAYLTDVVVVLEELDNEQTLGVVELLKSAGLAVSSVDHDRSVVEGTVESTRAHDLKSVQHVRYVRPVITYAVDFPPGDPRDRDGR